MITSITSIAKHHIRFVMCFRAFCTTFTIDTLPRISFNYVQHVRIHVDANRMITIETICTLNELVLIVVVGCFAHMTDYQLTRWGFRTVDKSVCLRRFFVVVIGRCLDENFDFMSNNFCFYLLRKSIRLNKRNRFGIVIDRRVNRHVFQLFRLVFSIGILVLTRH